MKFLLLVLFPTITFSQATGPLRVSGVNPRYLVSEADTTRAIWLGGFHLWGNAQDGGNTYPPTVTNMAGYWDSLNANRNNFVRLWSGWEQAAGLIETGDDWYWEPMPFKRTGPGNANDGRLKFNLDSLNEAFFNRMYTYCDSLRLRGIYVSVQLFDGWSNAYPNHGYSAGNPWYYHPYNSANNVNSVNGDPNGNGSGEEVHYSPYGGGTGVAVVWLRQRNYITKFIDELNDLDNIFWEICNEPEGFGEALAWQNLIADSIHAYEARKPKQHVVWLTAGDYSNGDLFASRVECIAPGGYGSETLWKAAPPDSGGRKVVIQDTDHIWGMLDEDGVPWIWKNFCNGNSVCLQDNFCSDPSYPFWTCDDPLWYPFKRGMGVAIELGRTADLLNMTPQPGKCTTSDHCLFGAATGEVIVYQDTGSISINLSEIPDSMNAMWYDPDDFVMTPGARTYGGGLRTLTPPDPRYRVLYLYDDASANEQLIIRESIKVLLEGPFVSTTGLMANSLYQGGILPSHFVNAAIPVQAVDSIMIEIRNAASAAGSTTRKFAPAWLLTDGTIRDFSDTTKNYVEFDTTAGNYYLVVWHRNHLPVMAATSRYLDGNPSSAYDFTTAPMKAYGSNAMKQIGSRFVLYAGDADSNFGIGASDIVNTRTAIGALGYTNDDIDMNGGVGASDILLCRFNVGHSSSVPP